MSDETIPAPTSALQAGSGEDSAPTVVNRGGRPRKRTLDDRQRALISALAAGGATEQMIAGQLGCSHTTLRRAFREDERNLQAFEVGRSQLGVNLVGELVRRALDPKAPQSTIALIYATKALFGFRDRGEEPAADGSARLKLELTLPRALPMARYAELVDRARRIQPDDQGDGAIDAEVIR